MIPLLNNPQQVDETRSLIKRDTVNQSFDISFEILAQKPWMSKAFSIFSIRKQPKVLTIF